MSRYIDADALKRRVGELIVPEWVQTLIRTWLESAPTIDAVPVVRCRECKYRGGNCGDIDNDRWCYQIQRYVDWDWFCADGERNDGEHED